MSTGGASAAAESGEAGTLLKQSCWDERKERRKVEGGRRAKEEMKMIVRKKVKLGEVKIKPMYFFLILGKS